MRKSDRKGLGRGLSALLADTDDAHGRATGGPATHPDSIPIDRIVANPDQPRREFSEPELEELARSVARSGIIQPLVVRPLPGTSDRYQIVAGERRWRAAQRARLHEVPAIVRTLSDEEVIEIAIVENVQRVDLNAVEEALGYRQLTTRFGHSQERVAEGLGKSRSHVANTLRLLSLPEPVLDHLRAGRLSAGHARALIPAEDPPALAEVVIARGLSVRETEALVRDRKKNTDKKQKPKPEKDADTRAIEGELSAQLKLPVSIDHMAGSEGGALRIRYRTLDDLDRLLRLLSGS